MNTGRRFNVADRKKPVSGNTKGSVSSDIDRIYRRNRFSIGWPEGKKRAFKHLARKNTAAIVGVALGDEGKGRLVDNAVSTFLNRKKIKKVYVVRFQGGNNAGHSVEKGEIKLALHVVPSGILYPKEAGIMDRGMIIHPEDLQTEVTFAEELVGPLHKRLYLSNDAILCTDLERAEEYLNGIKEGLSKGATGRGIGPSYAHHYDKTGLRVDDLVRLDWRKKLEAHYDRYDKEFKAFGLKLKDMTVPDFRLTKKKRIAVKRTVGDKATFLRRLRKARLWLVKQKMVTNTFLLHQEIFNDPHSAVIFEGAQSAGLDAWIGTRPDVTSSNTSAYGVREGTGFWRIEDLENRIGVIKIPYTSSVGSRRMPTHVDLPKDLAMLDKNPGKDQAWAAFVREAAHEYGTTTGRPRDINHLDLNLISYNARMAGIESLVVTHADIAREADEIKICVGYKDKAGTTVPYQPGLRFLKDLIPQYVTLPGWDGEVCRKAKTIHSLPVNCLKFLAFIQARTSFPIVAATTGPSRENLVTFPGYLV
jgi:adenylosuccinate synthase